jgi:hypothetical protein
MSAFNGWVVLMRAKKYLMREKEYRRYNGAQKNHFQSG